METDFAISEFLIREDLPKISCIFKHRYTDFIVQEISPDGTIVSSELSFQRPRPMKKTVERPDFITDEELTKLEKLSSGEKYTLELPVRFLWRRISSRSRVTKPCDDKSMLF